MAMIHPQLSNNPSHMRPDHNGLYIDARTVSKLDQKNLPCASTMSSRTLSNSSQVNTITRTSYRLMASWSPTQAVSPSLTTTKSNSSCRRLGLNQLLKGRMGAATLHFPAMRIRLQMAKKVECQITRRAIRKRQRTRIQIISAQLFKATRLDSQQRQKMIQLMNNKIQ